MDSPIIAALKREAALTNTYGKGHDLARLHKVTKCFSTDGEFGHVVDVSGAVKASYGPDYKTGVTLNIEGGEVVDYYCNCPASYKYPGMCKHEIALALQYLNQVGLEPLATGDGASAKKRMPARATAAPYAAKALPTSPNVLTLMDKLDHMRAQAATLTRSRRLAAAAAAPTEPASFEVTLLPAKDQYYVQNCTWCLKLKVRRGKVSYIVKNMATLVTAWKSGEELAYGKNLSLVHVPSTFTEQSARLLDLVTAIVDSQQALFSSRWRYMDAGRGTDIKELPLSTADVIQVLDIMQGASVNFEPPAVYVYGHGIVQNKAQVEVGMGDPILPARIVARPDGGYELTLPGGVFCFAQGIDMYLVGADIATRCSKDLALGAAPIFSALLPMSEPLVIAAPDVPDFCRTLLPLLRVATQLEAPEELDDLVPPEAELTFHIGLDDGVVSCDAQVTYGDWEASLYEPVRPGQPARDAVAEVQAQDVLETYFPLTDKGLCFDESDDELLFLLLTEGLAELAALGEVFLTERLRAVAVRDAPSLSVTATVKSGLLDVAVDSSGMADADLVAYLAAYRRKQRFVRLKNGDLMRIGESARAVDDLAEGLDVDIEHLASGVGLPTNRALFIDALLKDAEGVRLHRNAGFRQIVRDFDTYSDADFEVPESLSATLRPYQVDGFRWLETLGRFGFGGILADDMGLGKTLQMIAHLLARKEAAESAAAGSDGATGGNDPASDAAAVPLAPALIVCPASLVYNWMAELERFAPALDAVAVVGTKTQRTALIGGAGEHDVLVTSYDLMKRDAKELAGHEFSAVVLDEAQYIKNPRTQAAKCAKSLRGRERFALTGTPIENRLGELWSIFDFLMPGVLGTSDAFAKHFAGPIERGEFTAAKRLQCMVSPFILRRLKADVLADLPEKDESVVYAQLEGEQSKLYRATQDLLARQVGKQLSDDFKKKKLQVLAELTKLRQICCDPSLYFEGYSGGSAKLDTCMELVANALDGGHKVLLFSQFTSMLDIIGKRMEKEGIPYLMLTGSTGKEARRRLVEAFQAGAAPVFLISLKAGGVGLNLTAADVVIHYDPWWNLAAQNQATDRAHRIGQENPVSVFKLIAKDTIEERILKMQETKRDLAESVLSGRDISTTELTREDVLLLLGGSQG